MKIVLLSPSQKHLHEMGNLLQGAGHQVVRIEGSKSHLRSIADRERPDLLLADGMCCDVDELPQVEQVTNQHPHTAVLLLCPSHTPDYLLNAMRAGVREVLPSPAAPEALLAAVDRVAAKMGRQAASAAGARVFAFLPAKGGCGATFLATNIAWELARAKSVLLVDLNLQFGDAVSFLHDRRPPSTIADIAANGHRLDAAFLAASTVKVTPQLHVVAAPEDPGQALEVHPEQVEAVLSLAAREYDFVLLDLGHALDTLAIKALDRAERIFTVLQANVPALRHAGKLRQVFGSLGYPPHKTQFVLNGSDPSGDITLEHVQRSLPGASVLALPDAAREVNASINRGEPLVESFRATALARQLVALARELNPQPEEQKTLLGRIFRKA